MTEDTDDTEETEEEEDRKVRRRERRPATRRRYVNRGGHIAEVSGPPARETR